MELVISMELWPNKLKIGKRVWIYLMWITLEFGIELILVIHLWRIYIFCYLKYNYKALDHLGFTGLNRLRNANGMVSDYGEPCFGQQWWNWIENWDKN